MIKSIFTSYFNEIECLCHLNVDFLYSQFNCLTVPQQYLSESIFKSHVTYEICKC